MNPVIQAQLQTALPILLPMIASGLSYLCQQDHYPNWVNGSIATSAILLASVATLFAGGKLTGDVYGDAALAFTTATALQAETFAPLQKYIRTNWFVHASIVDPQATLPRPTVKSPQPIELGTKAYVPRPMIPPRAPQTAQTQAPQPSTQPNPPTNSSGSVHGG